MIKTQALSKTFQIGKKYNIDLKAVDAVTLEVQEGEVMASVAAAPFKLQFDTNNFDPGLHRLTAEVKTTTGETHTTNGLVSNFIEKGEANQSMLKILLLVGGIVVASMGIPFFMQKNANKNPNYDENGRVQYGV